jgi:hypothetical protein
MRIPLRYPLLLLLYIVAKSIAAPAIPSAYAAEFPLPEAREEAGISYITGGIGEEELAALKQVRGDYNFHATSTFADGAFSGSTVLTIADRDGNELLSTEIGPVFYANLPTGSYIITAMQHGKEKTQRVSIRNGKPVTLNFAWAGSEGKPYSRNEVGNYTSFNLSAMNSLTQQAPPPPTEPLLEQQTF